ncbi:MAG TPA: hypothetical protein VJ767_11190 [Nitrososphaeraceae archaeon]|nr:hypothetical protein [Nitrososphaeraceae archaeon]
MKNISILLTIGILLVSAAVLTSLPRNVAAQAMNATDYMMTEEEIKTKITDFKAKHPKFAAILEEIPNLDLKETIKAKIATEALQKMLKFHAKNLVQEKVTNQTSSPLEEMMTDEEIQAKVGDFKAKHPKFAAVVEGISTLDLKETVKGYIAAEAVQKLLMHHAKNLVEQVVP